MSHTFNWQCLGPRTHSSYLHKISPSWTSSGHVDWFCSCITCGYFVVGISWYYSSPVLVPNVPRLFVLGSLLLNVFISETYTVNFSSQIPFSAEHIEHNSSC